MPLSGTATVPSGSSRPQVAQMHAAGAIRPRGKGVFPITGVVTSQHGRAIRGATLLSRALAVADVQIREEKVKGVPLKPANDRYVERTNVQGKDNWVGLFTPGNRDSKQFSEPTGPHAADIQRYLLMYGDLAEMTYDNFKVTKDKKKSTWRNNIDKMVKLPFQYPYPEAGTSQTVNVPTDSPARRYTNIEDPVFFLFATSGFYRGEFPGAWDDQSFNWIGYVAISDKDKRGLRDIVVAWRGTIMNQEWLSDIADSFTDWDGTSAGKVQVAKGFEAMYRHFGMTAGNTLSLQGQVHVAIRKLLARYGEEVGSITTTGHSLGGALASLSAFDIANSGINRQGDDITGRKLPVTAVTFEAPRVGNADYAKMFADPDGGLKQLRVENLKDIVTLLPALAWSQANLLPWNWGKIVTFVAGVIASLKGGPEAMSSTAFHQAGTLYLVDTNTLYGQNLGVQEHPDHAHPLMLLLSASQPAAGAVHDRCRTPAAI